MTWVVGADIGGTFTDVVMTRPDGSEVVATKVPTTADDPVRGVLAGVAAVLEQGGVDPAEVGRVVHATTLATNLILEGTGGPIAYVTTAGFADVVRIGQEIRTGAAKFDVLFDPPVQLVERRHVYELDERIDAQAKVHRPLRDEDLAALGEWAGGLDVTAIAVCLLHSYVDPSHEQRVGAVLRAASPGTYVALSSETWPEYREYERAMTTMVSAYVGPALGGYVDRLRDGLRALGLSAPFEVMQSSGGIMSADQVLDRAVSCIESGPAAGVVAARELVQRRDRADADAVSFDMGGTTAKAGLLRGGRVAITHDFRVNRGMSSGAGSTGMGVPLMVPVVDVAEVGTGGGSIAWVDDGGLLRVGPRSAGSQPGPACYLRGGTVPTVTDADLVLGYLGAGFIGQDGEASFAAARDAILRHVAEPLGFDLERAAHGVHDVANAGVATAIRVMSLHRGVDPRALSMVAFGGAGPVHAVRIAESCDIGEVVVPPLPGVFSGLGLLVSDRTYDSVRTFLSATDALDPAAVDALFVEMEAEAAAVLGGGGADESSMAHDRALDLRFRRQSHALSVPVPSIGLSGDALAAAFRAEYERQYGIQSADPVEIVNLRVRSSAPSSADADATLAAHPRRGQAGLVGRRRAHFAEADGYIDAPVFHREALLEGEPMDGPLLIDEPDSTIVVPPGFSARADTAGNVVVTAG